MGARVVLKDGRFPDGSKVPFELVADRLKQPTVVSPSGKHANLHQFGVPHYTMAGTDRPSTNAHSHDTNYVQLGNGVRAKLKHMDANGVRISTSMPIPTSLLQLEFDGHGKGKKTLFNIEALEHELGQPAKALHHCGDLEFYYVPQKVTDLASQLNSKQGIEREFCVQDLRDHPQLLPMIRTAAQVYVDTAVNSHQMSALAKAGLNQAERSRIDPMMTGIHLKDPRNFHKVLTEMYWGMKNHNESWTGFGEATLSKEFIELLFAGEQARPGDGLEPLKNLLDGVGALGGVFTLHCDHDSLQEQLADYRDQQTQNGSRAGRPPSNREALETLFSDDRVKDTKLVHAHAGGLGRFVMGASDHVEWLDEQLTKNKNLFSDFSWSQVAKQVTGDEATMEKYVALIEKHSHKIMIGEDDLAAVNAEKAGEVKKMYAPLLERLSDLARENFLNHTYDHVFGEARESMRWVASKVLTDDFFDSRMSKANGPDGKPNQPVTPDELRKLVREAREREGKPQLTPSGA